MRMIRRFAHGESGAATLDWAVLGMSLAALVAVSVLSAAGTIAVPPAPPAAAAAKAPVLLPAPAGFGS